MAHGVFVRYEKPPGFHVIYHSDELSFHRFLRIFDRVPNLAEIHRRASRTDVMTLSWEVHIEPMQLNPETVAQTMQSLERTLSNHGLTKVDARP